MREGYFETEIEGGKYKHTTGEKAANCASARRRRRTVPHSVTTTIPPPSTLPTTTAPPLGRSNAEATEKRKSAHSHTSRHH
jgi:hypothetical protein